MHRFTRDMAALSTDRLANEPPIWTHHKLKVSESDGIEQVPGTEEITMSDVEAEMALDLIQHSDQQHAAEGRFAALAGAVAMPAILLTAMLGCTLPGRRDQRGVTTVEYIFGALIGIAIVGCIVGLFSTNAFNGVIKEVINWIFGHRPGGK
jgi:Flp pilus assembly pilin Flp